MRVIVLQEGRAAQQGGTQAVSKPRGLGALFGASKEDEAEEEEEEQVAGGGLFGGLFGGGTKFVDEEEEAQVVRFCCQNSS
jgi:hypothetical protein